MTKCLGARGLSERVYPPDAICVSVDSVAPIVILCCNAVLHFAICGGHASPALRAVRQAGNLFARAAREVVVEEPHAPQIRGILESRGCAGLLRVQYI